MPKQKTHQAAAKRIKKTKGGKGKPMRRSLEPKKRKVPARHQKRGQPEKEVSKADWGRIKSLLPYKRKVETKENRSKQSRSSQSPQNGSGQSGEKKSSSN